MKLSRIWLERYGPLQGGFDVADGLQLVYGPNEAGKSLLVEAVVKLVGGSDAVTDESVNERPEGFVRIEEAGVETQFGPSENLLEYYAETYGYELSPEELHNVFVIRDGDLRIEDEDAFYERVTDRITGIRTRDIRRVKAALRETGRLTETRLDVSADDRYDSARDQLERATELGEEVRTYLERAEREDVQDLEARLLRARRRRGRLEREERELEAARERARYDALLDAAERLRSAIETRRALPPESAIDELRARLARYDRAEQTAAADRSARYLTVAEWALAMAAVTFVAVLALGAPMVALGGPVVGVVAAGYFAAKMQAASRRVAAMDAARTAMLETARRLELSVEDVGDLGPELERIQQDRREATATISEERGVFREQLDVTADDPETVHRQATDELEAMAAELEPPVDREYHESELESVRADLEAVEDRIERLHDALRAHREQVRRFGERAHALDVRTFTGESLDLEVRNLDALESLVDRLDEFVDAIEHDAAVSRTAHEVFETIEQAETEKVRSLFGEGSPATELFGRITEGRYEAIHYDADANEIVVERPSGRRYTPSQLSKGTRDQLYLCIRVGLARQLPNVESGFFVMDDAFLAADEDRLERQAAVLGDLVESGWQVLYLTAKREAIEALRPHADGQVVELDRLS